MNINKKEHIMYNTVPSVAQRNATIKKKILLAIQYIILSFFLVTCIYPIIWMVINSFKSTEELFTNTWGLPHNVTIANYYNALVKNRMLTYFGNSVLISALSVAFTLILALLAAYGVTRLRWRGGPLMLKVFLLGLMIPAYGSIIPLYSMFMRMGILNQYTAVIIPHVTFGLSTAIFILSGFFISIPQAMEEAAVIDGCSVIGAFFRVVCPLATTGTVTVSVISFVAVWNDLLFSQIFLNEKSKMPLPIGLMEFKGMYATDHAGMIAAVVITVIPIILVYTILHKYIIEGMVAGAVKG